MIPFKKNLLFTLIVGVVILAMIPTSGYARVVVNGSSGGYDDGDNTLASKSQSSSSAIEMYIIEGAGYFLNAYSDILAFLNRVEESDLDGMNYNDALQILDRAQGNMNSTLKTYYYLIRRVEYTPYNEKVIEKLLNFDYASFEEKWHLNSELFNIVVSFLSKGDVTGVYKYVNNEFSQINKTLNLVRTEISLGKIPDMSILWGLNERCSQVMIFGQYISRVFYAIQ